MKTRFNGFRTYSVTFDNPVHKTTVTVRPHHDEGGPYLTRQQFKRVLRCLCGIEDCRCFNSPGSGDLHIIISIVPVFDKYHLRAFGL